MDELLLKPVFLKFSNPVAPRIQSFGAFVAEKCVIVDKKYLLHFLRVLPIRTLFGVYWSLNGNTQ